MKIALVVCTMMSLAAAQSQTTTPANGFTGHWVLDPAKSVLHESGVRDLELTVADDGREVRVTEHIRSSDNMFSCSPGAASCEQTTAGGSLYQRTLQRNGDVLSWRISMTRAADGATISFTEEWSLSDARQTLTIHRVYPGREIVQVFARKR